MPTIDDLLGQFSKQASLPWSAETARDYRVWIMHYEKTLERRVQGRLHEFEALADGFTFRPERPADAIVVNAGVSHLSLAWLDSLAVENGRLLVPLTSADRSGAFLLITRLSAETRRYPAKFVSRTGIIACVGGRDAEAEVRLSTALQKSDFTAIQSLSRTPEEPDDTCWLAGDGWWLSTSPVSGDAGGEAG